MGRLSSHFDSVVEGDWVGEYEILERLRSGGMATLFLGRRHGAAGFRRLAAIKVIHPHLSYDERFVRMFVDEARICSQISHPNVVHVEEFGQDNGLHYLSMEYIEGCSISQLLRYLNRSKREISTAFATRIIMQVAAGLHGAHETRGEDGQPLGVIHRDVSPSNVLLSTDGHIKVIDFGIAMAKGRLAETRTGYALKGKLRYMSPEQAMRGDIDRRSDIYSLGICFWELLTQESLHGDADEIALLERLRTGAIEPPSRHNPGVSPALDHVVLKMLSRDRDNRFATAWDVRRALVDVIPDALKIESIEIGAMVGDVRAALDAQRKERASLESEYPAVDGSYSVVRTPGGGLRRKSRVEFPEEYEMIEQIDPEAGFLSRVGATLSKHRVALIAASLVLVGFLGGRLLMGGGDEGEPLPVTAAPANTDVAPAANVAPAAKADPAPAAKVAAAEPVDQPDGDDADGAAQNEPADTDSETAPAPAQVVAAADEPKPRARKWKKRRRSNKASQSREASRSQPAPETAANDFDSSPPVTPTTKASSLKIDDVVIADSSFDDGPSTPKKSSKSKRKKSGSSVERVGDVPIAGDFDQ